jgi:catecholate siderophore receptor
MGSCKIPSSLRPMPVASDRASKQDPIPHGVIATTWLIAAGAAAGTATSAEAQQGGSSLPPVTVNPPVVRQRPIVAMKPTPSHVRARTALRRKARQTAPAHARPVPGPTTTPALPVLAQLAPSANPYAQPGAPYKINRVQSVKITEPIANTPRTITVLSKEVLADKGATTLRELGRSTAGVTLGTGEGGNAFGDRFFIRGFDARNDVFVDGMRDPAVSVRENFFTEQVEILRGPGSTFAGRGTAGGAINIVTKKATTDGDFRIVEGMGSPTDRGGRFTIDVNQVISPILAVRVNGMFQDSKVAGRDLVTDHRAGGAVSVVFKPIEPLKLTFDYIHVDLAGLPDFGVPYFRANNRPFTEGIIPRNTYYGFVNRDFQKIRQDFATVGAEYQVNDFITLTSKFRREQAFLNYVGTLAEAPSIAGSAFPGGTVSYNPQSRYQPTAVLANQNDMTIKWFTGPWKQTTVVGTEFSHEQVTRDSYAGLTSEALGLTGITNGGSLLFPPNYLNFRTPTQIGNPVNISVDTKAGYLIHTANYQDFVILNGGIRLDDYTISAFSPSVSAAGFLLKQGNPFTAFAYNHSTMFNYNLGGVVKPLPWWSLYTAYATSSNPIGAELDGTTAQYGGLNFAGQIFAPEQNKAVEVGTKFELFDRRLLVTGALFQTTKDNAREITGSGATATVSARAAYRVQGIDLEVAGSVTDRWSLIGGLVLMQSKITKSAFPTNVGLPLANIAHASFSLLSKYKVTNEWEVGGQAVYNSRRYGGSFLAANGGTAFNALGLPAPTAANPFVNVPTQLPSYWRFDAFTEYKVTENVTAKVQAINIFNRTYYDAFYQSAAPFAQVAPGRSVQFSVKATF